MAKNLVIVESPTKAKTISKMLGKNYKVLASVGHLRDLPKSRLGVDIENNFEPEYINVRGKAPKINELKKEAKKADKVFLATDPDREGESISWHLAFLLGLDPEEKNRVEFNEITKDEVLKAIKNPRKIDLDLVDSQQARRVLDRIVGYKLSPVLWKKIKNGLSAGRVQSVALKLICDREREIENFIPEEYWSLEARHLEAKVEFTSKYYGDLVNGKEVKVDLVENEERAREIEESVDIDSFILRDIAKSTRSKNPSKPFTTSTIQQEASNKLKFSTSKTMSLAQQLYEGVYIGSKGTVGLITYMRTDSTRLSDQLVAEAKKFILETYGKEYTNGGMTYQGKKKPGTQDAHEAIRPTSIYNKPSDIKEHLSSDQYKLYKLIWTRTMASQMAPAKYEQTSLSLVSNYRIFKASGNIMKFDGYMRLWDSKEKQNILPELKKGQSVKTLDLEKNQHFTKAKARYTEASLVKELEENGIGRPSTYSSIVNSILSRNYAEIKNRQFHPTSVGITVNDLLMEYFDGVINEEFTANMEIELDKVAEDEREWKEVISKFYSGFEGLLDKAIQDAEGYKIKDKVLDEKCPECGENLVEKNGRNGKFIGCSGFPSCKFTKSIVKSTGVACPKCGHDIIEKVTKRGRAFFGCSNYPSCDYASWNKPIGEKCPKCSDLLVRKKNRHGDFILCNNDDCDFEKPYDKDKKS